MWVRRLPGAALEADQGCGQQLHPARLERMHRDACTTNSGISNARCRCWRSPSGLLRGNNRFPQAAAPSRLAGCVQNQPLCFGRLEWATKTMHKSALAAKMLCTAWSRCSLRLSQARTLPHELLFSC